MWEISQSNQDSQKQVLESCLISMSNHLEIPFNSSQGKIVCGFLSKKYPCLTFDLSCHVGPSQRVAWLVLNKSVEFFSQNETGWGWRAAIINSYASLLPPKNAHFCGYCTRIKLAASVVFNWFTRTLMQVQRWAGYNKMQQEWEISWELSRLSREPLGNSSMCLLCNLQRTHLTRQSVVS